MSEVTHLICAHCGGDNAVSNYQEQSTIRATEIAGGLFISFNCQHCGKEYSLVKPLSSAMKPAVIETCDNSHQHYKEQGSQTRFPFCLAVGLEARAKLAATKPVVEAAQAWATVCAPADVHPADEERAAIILVEAIDAYKKGLKGETNDGQNKGADGNAAA